LAPHNSGIRARQSIDGGSLDCVLQYKYTHDNDGPGLIVYTYPYASFTVRGSAVRFNISENDPRKSRNYAGLWLRADGREITGVEVYNSIGPRDFLGTPLAGNLPLGAIGAPAP